MPPKIFLLRHGQSLANIAGLIASNPLNATTAYGLSDEGREQVRRSVAASLAAGDLPAPRRVISSPLLRARESGEITAGILGVDIEIDPRLRERGFGTFELQSDRSYERVWAADRKDSAHESWEVESVDALLARTRALVDELCGDDRTATIILSTHGDVASVLLCDSAGVALGSHREVGALSNGELKRLR